MRSTSHSVEDWSRVGSAKGVQRGLTRAHAANLMRVSIFERHQTPPSPRAVSRQRGSTPRGDHLSDLLSSSLHLGCAIQSTAHAKRASLLVLVLSSSFDLGLRGLPWVWPRATAKKTGVNLRQDHLSCCCFNGRILYLRSNAEHESQLRRLERSEPAEGSSFTSLLALAYMSTVNLRKDPLPWA